MWTLFQQKSFHKAVGRKEGFAQKQLNHDRDFEPWSRVFVGKWISKKSKLSRLSTAPDV